MAEQETIPCLATATLQQLIRRSPERLILIDVRTAEEYGEMHIPGAVNIPLPELGSATTSLSKQSVIVTACGKGGGRSAEAAVLLRQSGFKNVRYLCGGTHGWFANR